MNKIKNNLTNSFDLNINGIRGLAVILVFLFHLDNNLFSGGYIGVDIFFIISGYLICNSINKILSKEKNVLKSFNIYYQKRILRIFPAVLFLIIFVIVIFNLIFSKTFFFELIQSSIYSLSFLSNIFFWNQSGYFGLENSFKPLLHTWSLSVEMQVYLVLPLVILLINSLIKNFYFFFLILASITFLFISEIFIDRPFVYFLPIFRIHEFFLGIIIFYYLKNNKKKINNKSLSYFGIILIFLASTILDKNSNFPGLNSLIPLMGSAIIIINTYKNIILTNKLTQFFGNISYSFYLYHWPIIIFFKNFFLKINFSLVDSIIILFLTTFSSFLSFKYIEKNINFKNNFKTFTFFYIFILLLIILFSFYYSNKNHNNISNFSSKEIKQRNNYLINNKIFNPNADKKVIILGDSHAQDLYISFLKNNFELSDYQINYLQLNANCLKYLNKVGLFKKIENKIYSKIYQKNFNSCINQVKNFKSKNFEEFDNVLISNRWTLNNLTNFKSLINELYKKNSKGLIVFDRRPSFLNIPDLYNKFINSNKLKDFNKLNYQINDTNVLQINKKLKKISEEMNLETISLYNIICNEKEKKCYTTIGNKELLFIDNDHFSFLGFNFFGKKITKQFLGKVD